MDTFFPVNFFSRAVYSSITSSIQINKKVAASYCVNTKARQANSSPPVTANGAIKLGHSLIGIFLPFSEAKSL